MVEFDGIFQGLAPRGKRDDSNPTFDCPSSWREIFVDFLPTVQTLPSTPPNSNFSVIYPKKLVIGRKTMDEKMLRVA